MAIGDFNTCLTDATIHYNNKDTDDNSPNADSDSDVDTDSDSDNDTITVKIGDVNRDGVITALDSFIVQRVLVNYDTFDEIESFIADVNGDGALNTFDCLYILRYSVGYSVDAMVNEDMEFVIES